MGERDAKLRINEGCKTRAVKSGFRGCAAISVTATYILGGFLGHVVAKYELCIGVAMHVGGVRRSQRLTARTQYEGQRQ